MHDLETVAAIQEMVGRRAGAADSAAAAAGPDLAAAAVVVAVVGGGNVLPAAVAAPVANQRVEAVVALKMEWAEDGMGSAADAAKHPGSKGPAAAGGGPAVPPERMLMVEW